MACLTKGARPARSIRAGSYKMVVRVQCAGLLALRGAHPWSQQRNFVIYAVLDATFHWLQMQWPNSPHRVVYSSFSRKSNKKKHRHDRIPKTALGASVKCCECVFIKSLLTTKCALFFTLVALRNLYNTKVRYLINPQCFFFDQQHQPHSSFLLITAYLTRKFIAPLS